jgi:hypothetical protein
VHPRHGAASAAALLAAFALSGASVAAQAPLAATLGTPFTLHVGQSALLASLHVTLAALEPQGECPDHRAECVAVSPPQAELDIADGTAAPVHLVLMLPGNQSAPSHAGRWRVQAVDVTPFPFTRADIAAHRAAVTLLISAPAL